uniref:non-specific serine/threonine protein kinase n=1 Tax=Leersia perrieri TaxID=77586 RepID=A0A0D9Y0A9_9ORYZ
MPLQNFQLVIPLLLLLPHGRWAADSTTDHGQFVYNAFTAANLTADGAATVTQNGLLMLTNGTIQMKGHAFHPSPLPFRDPNAKNATARSFSTTFVFAIYGQYEDLSAAGLAFFVATDMAVLSTALPGQFLGLVNGSDNGNRSTGLFAVEFDTLFNADIGDMNSNHVGVDIDGVTSRVAANAGYYDDDTGMFRNMSLVSRKAMQAWIDYDGVAAEITVTIAPLGVPRPKKPLLQTTINLSDAIVPDSGSGTAYVGFSSATGMVFSRHFVLGWSFSLDRSAPSLNISELPALPPTGPKPRSKTLEIVLPIASAMMVLMVGISCYTFLRRQVKYAELREDWEIPFGPHRFSYKDLFSATRGFSDKRLLGAGGFGRVYKGVLHKKAEDVDVAVKRVSHESKQGMKEFVAEVVSLGRLRHRNLVPLLGYCRRKGELILVYDYMPNGSLDEYLYGRSKDTLQWPQRFHIIRGVASGLLYLHEDWEQVVIHRDVKASNVLLDGEMNGRLGDFGLARLYDHGADAYTTHVVGTMGYLAPELGHIGKATPATDVFAFGAFLLEVTCGRRPVEQDQHNNRVMLVDRVIEHWRKGLIVSVVDSRILNGYNSQEVSLVLKLGLLCSHPLPNMRPTMRQVVQYLDGSMVLSDLSPAIFYFTEMERMHPKDDLNHGIVSTTSMGSISDISGGRATKHPSKIMYPLPISLVVLLLVTHVASSAADGEFIYEGFASANLALDGLAVVSPNGLLVLTNATNQAKAHAFHPTPLHFRNKSGATTTKARSFSTSFVFAIVSRYDGLSDHGLAFVVTPTTNFSKANAGQYLGLLNATNGTASDRILAVELDTIINPEFRDINGNHVGIDLNSLMSEQARPAGYYDDRADGTLKELKLNSRKPMQVWVDYDGNGRQLNVTLSPVKMPKPTKPLLSISVDLSEQLADAMLYMGFSSATGVVPTRHYVLGWSFSLDGPAPHLDFSKLPSLPRVGPKPRSKVLGVMLPLCTALLIAAVLAIIFSVIQRRRRYAEVWEDWEDEFGPHRFSYKDLFHATDGFKDRNLLGVGGFGRVYKGVLRVSNFEIAVKRVSHDSRQGVKEFVAEVVSIGRLRHRNLVQLLGYCRRKDELLLVYDYMENGSLDKYLYDQHMPTLSWHERYRIIKGVAASLLYLHEDWEQVVIHRDIKPSNVLLDGELNGRLGDFGLARLYDHGIDPQTTHVVGTMGYLAPELVRTGKATPLTDVFAFGVFLLEVTCGQRPISRDDSTNQVALVDWVIEHHQNGSILDVVDSRLLGEYETGEVILVLKMGLICAHPLSNLRPSMRTVMQCLDSGQLVPDPSPSFMNYRMMTLMHNQGFDSYIMSLSSNPSMASIGASCVTVLSEGR